MEIMNIRQLAESLGSSPCFGPMPPLAGVDEPIRRIVTKTEDVEPLDVLLGLPRATPDGDSFWEEAYTRGALGVIAERLVAPWPGTFSIQVSSVEQALETLRQHYEDNVALSVEF